MTNHDTCVWMNDIRRAAEKAKSHWFDESTMRFFDSRVHDAVYAGPGGIYFVSSERGPNGIRAYTVRVVTLEPWSIDDVGGFQRYASYNGAHAAAKRLSIGGVKNDSR